MDTPTLSRESSGRLRWREFRAGIGASDGVSQQPND
jgi:hypothetical protein